jgi:hypothetical protein
MTPGVNRLVFMENTLHMQHFMLQARIRHVPKQWTACPQNAPS